VSSFVNNEDVEGMVETSGSKQGGNKPLDDQFVIRGIKWHCNRCGGDWLALDTCFSCPYCSFPA